MFPRRLITRGPDVNEDHECIDEKTLRNKVASGDIALAWAAHGLDYAVPSTIDEAIASGSVVVVNVSRTIIPQVLMKYYARRHRLRHGAGRRAGGAPATARARELERCRRPIGSRCQR